jgi:ADP-heptose:LPS heptosyltransferase
MVSRSKVEECYDTGAFESQWRNLFLLGDPYFNPNLSRNHDDFCAEREPVQMICAGHPLYDRASIRRILVVKVDHIGDCMTALSAVRRLRKHFPKAHIAVLSAKSSKVVWESEKSVDEVIEFNFFHARSGLGKVEVTADEFEALNQKLSARRFDLAVDLRKQPDTRHILKYTGARFLAGLDHQSQCPWLDIALEWEGDQPFQSKHTHVTDDLIRIVDALASCGDRDRQTLSVNRKSPLPLPAEERKRLFGKPVVCVHPAVGNVMRQWPPGHFAELIDLLIEQDDVHVAVIGGPDEKEIAQAVIDRVHHPHAVFNMVGRLKLSELPQFIAQCQLFVGNNSGPKHIAAGVGIPTVGIHSGVVDAKEWGPLGPRAFAVQRDMSCHPCYMEKPDDCPRGIACLNGLRPGDAYRLCQPLLAPERARRRT